MADESALVLNETDIRVLVQSKGGCGCNRVQLFGSLPESWGLVHDFESCYAGRGYPFVSRLGKPGTGIV